MKNCCDKCQNFKPKKKALPVCRTCANWEENTNPEDQKEYEETFGYCQAPLPMCLKGHENSITLPQENATDCAMYQKIKKKKKDAVTER